MSVLVHESFDDAKVLDLRLLHEAFKLNGGNLLDVALWTDPAYERIHGKAPKFPYAEREYFISNLRFVKNVRPSSDHFDPNALPEEASGGGVTWVFRSDGPHAQARLAAASKVGIKARALSPTNELAGFPHHELFPSLQMWTRPTNRKKVVVTGCYDYFHSGHVRFFEECSEFGDLYVCVGNDANVKALKGPKNPLFPQHERVYVVGCCRFATQSLVTTGTGWMDAAPDFALIKPDIYAVNEDGDKPDKAQWCQENGVEYKVLKRLPKPGLPRRTSTDMRGF
jgi:cytidyltransferase-like protein